MKITAPAAGQMLGEIVTHYGPLEVRFIDGVAEVDDLPDGVRAYLVGAGYEVDGTQVDQPEPAKLVDSRDVGHEQVGTTLRDAAVDPQPEDFLAPVNAGEHDPHGPLVASPGIHAEGERVVRSGPVSTDPDVQDAAEKKFAEKLLVQGEQITPPVAAGDFLEQGGPLGLSDPGSAEEGVEVAKANADAEGGEPRGNARLSDWQAYAAAQGATPEQIDGKTRDELRAEYGS